MVVADTDGKIINWAEDRIGVRFRDDAKAIARMDNGYIRVAVVYDTFYEFGCSMHVATDGTLAAVNRRILFEAFKYPFIDCGFKRVTGYVEHTNQKALKLDLHLGFQYEGLMREACKHGDLVVLGMLRKECRFIPRKYRR